jgi:hypothetical protein
MATSASTRDGSAVIIHSIVIERVDASCPAGMSRTNWINYLIQLGLASVSGSHIPKNAE